MTEKLIPYDLPEQRCPTCGKFFNKVSNMTSPNTKPQKGDVCVCFGCAEPLMFDENMRLHKMSREVLNSLSLKHQLILKDMVDHVKLMHAQMN